MQLNLMARTYKGTFWVQKLSNTADDWTSIAPSSGLTVVEDDKNIYVEAFVPGVDPDKLDVTLEKGALSVRDGNLYSFYEVLPGEVDESAEPLAVYKNGVIKITFSKKPEMGPKNIKVMRE